MSNEHKIDFKKDPTIMSKHNHERAVEEHIERITREFRQGFELVHKYPKSVTIFGSSMASPDSHYYKQAEEVAKHIVKELKYSVFTGGGPGIMEAASKGAKEAGGHGVGLRINLLREKKENLYNSDTMNFTYFFTRKTMLTFAAETYIYFPGGFGTFDELFSVLTLMQTNKIPRVPVILFGSAFWEPLKQYFVNNMLGDDRRIDLQDLSLFEITDSVERVIEIVRKAPVSEWWRNIN